jgi:hypothetical protein
VVLNLGTHQDYLGGLKKILMPQTKDSDIISLGYIGVRHQDITELPR